MLVQIHKLRAIVISLLLCALMTIMSSCATTHQDTRLVSDPTDRHDSVIPWNKQEPWETQGQFAGMTDRR
jgi:hypothetical protein